MSIRKRVDPIARTMAFNRRQTSTRVIQDKRAKEKEKEAKKEMKDANEHQSNQDKGKAPTYGQEKLQGRTYLYTKSTTQE